MSSLLPLRPTVTREPTSDSFLVNIDDEAADEVFAALSSSTAREILAALYDEPQTASDVANAVDTSLQNTKYHVDKLVDADLIEVVDIWYSEHGREMKVYAPSNSSVVLVASNESALDSLREAIKRLIGAIGLLGFVSFGIDRVIQILGRPSSADTTPQSIEIGGHTLDPINTGIQMISPSVLFFAGGLFVLSLISVWWYRSKF